jgi:hypothetical protein
MKRNSDSTTTEPTETKPDEGQRPEKEVSGNPMIAPSIMDHTLSRFSLKDEACEVQAFQVDSQLMVTCRLGALSLTAGDYIVVLPDQSYMAIEKEKFEAMFTRQKVA